MSEGSLMKIPQNFNRINPKPQNNIRRSLQSLIDTCYDSKQNKQNIKHTFIGMNNKYSKQGIGDIFCNEAEKAISFLEQNDKKDIATMLLDSLSKMFFSHNMLREANQALNHTLELNLEEGDLLHALARYSDLENIARMIGSQRDVFKILNQKKRCAKTVLKNYDDVAKNFKTISRTPTSERAVKILYARTLIKMAKIMTQKQPNNSIKMLQKAREIFVAIGEIESVNYIDSRIKFQKINELRDALKDFD